MRLLTRAPCCAALLLVLIAAGPHRQAGATYLVDTTDDGIESEEHCAEGKPCPLRSAVYLANNRGGGTVTAVLCTQPDEPGCLATDDPNYDPATGQWTFHLDRSLGALIMDLADVRLDFRTTVPGWTGPADNAIVIDGGRGAMARAVDIQGPNHMVAGIEFKGGYENAAIEASRRGEGVVLGPGLLFADVSGKAAIRIRDPNLTGTRIIGNWCGVTRTGAIHPVTGGCVLIDVANTTTVIGGPGADRNYFAAATGAAVSIVGPGADRNEITANWIGLGPDGQVGQVGGAGVDIRDAGGNVVSGNTIVRTGNGVRIGGTASFGNVIRENSFGFVPEDQEGAGPQAPNTGWAVALTERTGSTLVERNDIQYNVAGGVVVSGGQAENNRITLNRMRRNRGPAIQVSGGGNGGVEPPLLSIVRADLASGTACGECVIEFFSSEDGQAWWSEGSAIATQGRFIYRPAASFRGPFLTATATRSGGNTSALSLAAAVPGVPTVTPTSTPSEPSTPIPGAWLIFLPWTARNWTN